MISKEKTGHMYYRSPYESCDTCGNCDGAKCDSCVDTFIVDNVNARFYSIDNAKKAEEEIMSIANIDDKPCGSYTTLFIKDEILYADAWSFAQSKHIQVECNKESPLYQKLYDETLENHKHWDECICVDKDKPYCKASCDEYKCCVDSQCFHEMKHGSRTERKYYE